MECAAWSRSNLQGHHICPIEQGVKHKQMKGKLCCMRLRGSEVHPSIWMFLAKPLVSVNFLNGRIGTTSPSARGRQKLDHTR